MWEPRAGLRPPLRREQRPPSLCILMDKRDKIGSQTMGVSLEPCTNAQSHVNPETWCLLRSCQTSYHHFPPKHNTPGRGSKPQRLRGWQSRSSALTAVHASKALLQTRHSRFTWAFLFHCGFAFPWSWSPGWTAQHCSEQNCPSHFHAHHHPSQEEHQGSESTDLEAQIPNR